MRAKPKQGLQGRKDINNPKRSAWPKHVMMAAAAMVVGQAIASEPSR